MNYSEQHSVLPVTLRVLTRLDRRTLEFCLSTEVPYL